MVGTTDIPDWCYFETYGTEGNSMFTEAPSAEHLNSFLNKSPISHINKVSFLRYIYIYISLLTFYVLYQ